MGEVRAILEARGDGCGQWEVRRVNTTGFLAVGSQEETVAAAAEAGYVMADSILLHLQRWSSVRGAFPNPRAIRLRISLEGIPLILCDEEGVSLLVWKFNKVEAGSLQFAPAGSLTTIEASPFTFAAYQRCRRSFLSPPTGRCLSSDFASCQRCRGGTGRS